MIETDRSAAAVTVNVAEPLTLPSVAVIIVEPTAVAVASPFEPATLETLASPLDALQATEAVRFWVLWSV